MSTSTAPTAPSAWPAGYYRRRYVWQWPIRLSHWINALCIVVLFATGEYIAHPQLAPAGEAYKHFVMGRMREIHFAFAFVFLISFLWRIYWFWMGNNYARSGFPFIWRTAWWRDLTRQARAYLSLQRGHVHLGHNALAGLSYTIFVIGLGWLQILTGLALYSETNPGGFWDRLVGWVLPLFGGSYRTHLWHHMFSWLFLVFAIVHLYVVLFDSDQYKNGLMSSMVDGFKFYEEGDLDNDKWVS
jgi:Ni/Fe-hydrogenase 1 B-type cytochrome subunit